MGTGWRDARLWDRGLRMLEDTSMNTLTFHEYQSVRSNMNRSLYVFHSITARPWYYTPRPLNFEFPSKYLSGILWVLPFGENLIYFKGLKLFILGIMKLEKDWNSNFHLLLLIKICTKSISIQIEVFEICFRCDIPFPIAACKKRR